MYDIYLDNASTTPVCEECAEIAYSVMKDHYGNPSSTHTLGRDAASILKNARGQVSAALGSKPQEVYFTSCGSESDNWAIIRGARLRSHEGRHIISSQIEHDAVRKSLDYLESEGYEITRLKPDQTGSIHIQDVLEQVRSDTILVSLMMVNNETGAITDIDSIARQVHAVNPRILVHTDAVQAFMKIPFSAKKMDVDMISISGHKIHAPKGIGALYIRSGIKLPAYILGGGQENGMRAGTEALPQIAAFGLACEIAKKGFKAYTSEIRERKDTVSRLLAEEVPEAVILSGDAPHILSISLPGWRSEVLMNFMEAQGVYVSRSSACKKGARSHVLEAIGLEPEVIDGAIRVSFSRYNTPEDCEGFISCLKQARDQLSHR
ncbi:MAG: cysteine desulfurase [Oscillospiraceae bacterium]|nr:cysteine desulfurase [Oscillospiraceae bacterium]